MQILPMSDFLCQHFLKCSTWLSADTETTVLLLLPNAESMLMHLPNAIPISIPATSPNHACSIETYAHEPSRPNLRIRIRNPSDQPPNLRPKLRNAERFRNRIVHPRRQRLFNLLHTRIRAHSQNRQTKRLLIRSLVRCR